MKSKIKRQFMSYQYKEDVFNIRRLLKKHEWLGIFLFSKYDYLLLINENISYDD